MGIWARLILTGGVLTYAFVVRWFASHAIMPQRVDKLCKKWFGRAPRLWSFGRTFRSLGWQCCNAAVGLMVLAYVLESSHMRDMSQSAQRYDLLVGIGSFVILTLFYGCAVLVRFRFLDAAERGGTGRWRCGGVLWVLGLLMLLSSSWCVVGE